MSGLAGPSPTLGAGFTWIPYLIKHGIWVKSGIGWRGSADLSDTQRVLGQNLDFVLELAACLASFAGSAGFGG